MCETLLANMAIRRDRIGGWLKAEEEEWAMKTLGIVSALAALVLAVPAEALQDATAAAAEATATPAGIPLDSPWRRSIHAHAQENLAHPSWGWRHSERNYLLAVSLAEAEGLAIDPDVLFAAAFLHDWGGIAPFAARRRPCRSLGRAGRALPEGRRLSDGKIPGRARRYPRPHVRQGARGARGHRDA